MLLPGSHVIERVQLGCATTIHQAQRRTVDTAHALITSSMTREKHYVATTRGRHSNTLHVTLDTPADTEADASTHGRTGQEVLEGVLARTGTERSATQTVRGLEGHAGSLQRLVQDVTIVTLPDAHPDPLARPIGGLLQARTATTTL